MLNIQAGILKSHISLARGGKMFLTDRDSRLKTRNRPRIRPRYFSIQSLGLGLGIEVPRYSRLKGRKCHYLWLFEGKKAESDSKFRDSPFRTQNRSQNWDRIFTMQCLGFGLRILTYSQKMTASPPFLLAPAPHGKFLFHYVGWPQMSGDIR